MLRSTSALLDTAAARSLLDRPTARAGSAGSASADSGQPDVGQPDTDHDEHR